MAAFSPEDAVAHAAATLNNQLQQQQHQLQLQQVQQQGNTIDYTNLLFGALSSENAESNESEVEGGFEKEAFIEAIRKFRCLWDTNHHTYKDRNMKANAWKQLASVFQKDVIFLQKTLKNLKDNLKRCLDRRRALTRSGAAYHTLPTCKYFELMAFLHEKTQNKPTDSNINLNQTVSTHVLQDSQTFSQSQVAQPVSSSTYSAAPSPSSSTSSVDTGFMSPSPSETRKATKRKSSATSVTENSDTIFLQQMKDFDARIIDSIEGNKKEESESQICEETFFCKSLIPVLKGLPLRKKRLAKVKITALLYDIEFSNEFDNA